MALSKSKAEAGLYCRLRKMPVADLPEERVRQAVINKMIDELGFPASHISLEVPLNQMPHLQLKGAEIPDRRADVIVFASGIHPKWSLYPLLLIECKAVPLTQKALQQAAGYNHHVGAYFICLANGSEVKSGWYDPIKKEYAFIPFLPEYKQLVKFASRK